MAEGEAEGGTEVKAEGEVEVEAEGEAVGGAEGAAIWWRRAGLTLISARSIPGNMVSVSTRKRGRPPLPDPPTPKCLSPSFQSPSPHPYPPASKAPTPPASSLRFPVPPTRLATQCSLQKQCKTAPFR